ncbi:PAS/PAC sensor signal transduction histidine kinase [Halorientalis persicus]|uniref:histidine kinase n=1 Tax=Halorientalis persicus TaxID=1367881 RepID=A0A1H8G7S8_9EURY|nr:PAS domain-containing sensor histidine kinase [Halorientalis persicus]SEN39800.1 PAS/PAC sensor signal transduction histidine kinase [Halorientalis persicus]
MSSSYSGDLDPAVFEEMVEAVGVGVAIYDAEGVFRYVNAAYADLLETTRDDLVGRPVWSVATELEADRFDDYWDSFSEGETRAADTEHAVGERTVPVSTVTTRRRIDGTPYNFGTIRDRSELRARERELEAQNERLDTFAGIVAHDLRNPLNVAHSYLELLRADGDSDELEMIDSALSRMEILIDDLLTLAREGEMVGEPEPASLATVAHDAWSTVETGDADLTVAADAAVVADPRRLRQLFENLFRNAVEHGSTSPRTQAPDDAVEHGDRSVSVRVDTIDHGFVVADDGPGLPEGDRDWLFEPGESGDPDGSGIGLAIVAEIAKAHGWSVTAADREGDDTGARFVFEGVEFAD